MIFGLLSLTNLAYDDVLQFHPFYSSLWVNDKFLDTYDHPKLNQEDINHP
jgi:hypothetical protein